MRTAEEAEVERDVPEENATLVAALSEQWRTAPWYVGSVAAHSFVFLVLLLLPTPPMMKKPPRSIINVTITPPEEKIILPEEKVQPKDDVEPIDTPTDTKDLPIAPDIKIEEKETTDIDSSYDETAGTKDTIFANDSPLPDAPPSLMGVGDLGMSPGGSGKVGRGSNHAALTTRGHAPPRLDRYVLSALRWLAEHQESDGHWDNAKYGSTAHIVDPRKQGDVAVTSLALVAFFANGQSNKNGRFRETVAKGVYWLKEQQDPQTGLIGHHRYAGGIALMAIAEAYEVCGGDDLRRAAQKAVDYAVKSQNESGAFDYGPRTKRNDLSVTGWWVMGLKSAKVAGLNVPYEVFAKALKYVQKTMRVSEDGYGVKTTYMVEGGAVEALQPDFAGGTTRLVPIDLTCLQFLGMPRNDPGVAACASQILKEGVPGKGPHCFYRWYYGTLGMFQMGVRSPEWNQWNEGMGHTLIAEQVRVGSYKENKGSWNYERDPYGPAWGRVGQTAMGALMLEIYYRVPSLTDTQRENYLH